MAITTNASHKQRITRHAKAQMILANAIRIVHPDITLQELGMVMGLSHTSAWRYLNGIYSNWNHPVASWFNPNVGTTQYVRQGAALPINFPQIAHHLAYCSLDYILRLIDQGDL